MKYRKKRLELGKKNYSTIPPKYCLSAHSSTAVSWQVMLNINLCPWGKLVQRLDINKLVFNKQLSPGGEAHQDTIAGSEQAFTRQPLLQENPEPNPLSLWILIFFWLNLSLLSFTHSWKQMLKITNNKANDKITWHCLTLPKNRSVSKMGTAPASLHRVRGK